MARAQNGPCVLPSSSTKWIAIVWTCIAIRQMAAAATVAAGIPPVVLKPAAVQRQQHTDIASAANSTANGTAGDSWPPADRMIEWIVENGGEVNVVVRNTKEAGRSTWAKTDMVPGEVLARIPLHLCYKAEDMNFEVRHVAAAHLWDDMTNEESPYQPYFKALPNKSDVWSLHNFPPSYLPLVQNPSTEDAIMRNQRKLGEHWEKHKDTIQAALGAETSLDDLRYTMALLLTRLFQFTQERLTLVPLLDLANHRNDCPHTHKKVPCQEGGSLTDKEQCIVWRAQENLSAGQEVCNCYKFMLNDRTVLQYGFLQSGPVEKLLSGLDRHDYKPDVPWEELPAGEHGPLRFEGTPAAIVVELDRLQRLRSALQTLDREVAHIPADARDIGGHYLSTLRTWRQQRRAAVDLEIERLSRQLERLHAAEQQLQQLQGSGLGHPDAVYDAFVTSLSQQGAQVNVTVKSTAAEDLSRSACSTRSSRSAPLSTGNGVCSSGPQSGSNTLALLTNFPPSSVYAATVVKAGQPLAVIPLNATLRMKPANEGLLDTAAELLINMYKAQQAQGTDPVNSTEAFWWSYYTALPPLGSVAGMYSMPWEYLPLIQKEAVEDHIKAVQALVLRAWDKHRPAIEAIDNSLTVQEFKHAIGLINARVMAYDYGMFVVPLMGMANHQNNNLCPHTDYLERCPDVQRDAAGSTADGDRSHGIPDEQVCLYWMAGADVAAGHEVCVSYGYLLPDVALLQFGILLPEGDTPQLFSMDRHDFNPKNPFAPPSSGHFAPPPFTGSPEEALAEVSRLAVLHLNLTSAESLRAAAAITPSQHDRGGSMLAQLRILRQQRIAAVEAEMMRLMNLYGFSVDLVQQAAALRIQQEEEAAAAAAAALDDPWQQMFVWAREHGAVVDVDVKYVSPEAGRAVFTKRAMKKGDVLAAIPLGLAYSTAKHGGNSTNELAAANLWTLMQDPTHPLQPYFKTLPTRQELLAPLVDMPEEYLPLLQSELAVKAVRVYQQRIHQFWEDYQEEIQEQVPGTTIEDFKYARSLLSTRYFGGGPEEGNLMLPVIDLANHRQDCTNYQALNSCPGTPNRQCIYWVAGEYLQPGEEVCNFYQYMLNDRSMLQYGFVQADMLDVHTLDRPDVTPNSTDAWTRFEQDKYGPPAFNGTLQETQAEITRLTAIAAELAAGDVAAAAATPAPGDESGQLLQLLLRWRLMRQQAVQRQINILHERVTQLQDRTYKANDVDGRFLDWLSENGVQVHSKLELRRTDGDGSSRALFAAAPIAAQERLAVIPLRLAVPIFTENLLDDIPRLWKDMSHPASPRRPYWDILPANGTVFSYYNLPLEYLPLLQHNASETYIADTHAAIEEFVYESFDILAKSNMTTGDLLHVMALIATRVFEFDNEGAYLVPLIDLANHQNGCRHKLSVSSCPSPPDASAVNNITDPAPPKLCIYWKAGADVAKNQEICMAYGYLLPDRAILQYGFLLRQQPVQAVRRGQAVHAVSPVMSSIDRHDFPEGMRPWQYALDATEAPPPFQGTPSEIMAEVERLEAVHASLEVGSAAAAAVTAVPADKDGVLLGMLRQWREQRKAAVKQEIRRLKALALQL